MTKVEQADVAMPCLSNRTLFTLMLLVGLYFPSSAGGGWSTLRQMGFNVKQRSLTRLWTTAESLRIWRRGIRLTAQDRAAAKRLAADLIPSTDELYDFTEFVCEKRSDRATSPRLAGKNLS